METSGADRNKDIVEELRAQFAPLTERLTPAVEPAVVFSCLPAPLRPEPSK
jgi:hypothetical protein